MLDAVLDVLAEGGQYPRDATSFVHGARLRGVSPLFALLESGLSLAQIEEMSWAHLGVHRWTADLLPDSKALARLGLDDAERHGILPLNVPSNGGIPIAMVDPDSQDAHDCVRARFGQDAAIERYYVDDPEMLQVVLKAERAHDVEVVGGVDMSKIGRGATSARVDIFVGEDASEAARVARGLLDRAVRSRASDIHIDIKNETLIRMRVDGELRIVSHEPDVEVGRTLVNYFKGRAGMDQTSHDTPQDGQFVHHSVGAKDVSIRAATVPAAVTPSSAARLEKMVLRVLDFSAGPNDIEKLGYGPDALALLQKALTRRSGVTLATGPTGSGKTSTLYAIVQRMITPQRSGYTIEDPIEYEMPGVHQIEIQRGGDMTFATALRAVIRLDPDLVLVGEIRDRETADTALQAALTGHIVLSTLHVDMAGKVGVRLLEMGIEPYLASASLNAVLNQRLLRRLCPKCREPSEEPWPDDDAWGAPPEVHWRAHRGGCTVCGHSGHQGRIAAVEVLYVTEAVRDAIRHQLPQEEVVYAAKGDYISIVSDAAGKAKAGIVSVDEILGVIGANS